MRTLDSYLAEYAESHRNETNQAIHSIAVPSIMWSILGFLHTYTVFSPDFRLSYVLIFLAMIYYAFFKRPLLLLSLGVLVALMVLSFTFIPELRIVSITVFIVSWIFQFYGHKVEGKKPSFLKDIFFLLIGPIWVLGKTFPSLLPKNHV
ncbi:MAG: DUF962 domain-containing protein [Chitinophagaceae bacterium]|nr:DUF962 domain-containing protein [Oligoflexus sp.]